MQLTDLLSIEKWTELELELADKFNLQSSVFNPDGIRITNNPNWANSLCPVIKSTEKGQSFICAVAHMNMSNQARETKKAVVEECDAGLLKLVVPIFFKEEYLGVVGGCGLLAEDGEVDEFAINKITEMDEEKIQALSADVQTITDNAVQDACDFLRKRVEEIINDYTDRQK
ncbi:PocR ligand-binding domain-containing protein [Desulfobacter latus]|uniref:PocR ligand-binding domain-containing protein n=1 Tax=Desulfobacter latus TaxID=2292 RepID=A0A850SYL7_9BACT|nr:PocR ligand-binding domain-containing protein [Desulfobacter latus]NWH05230.1 PocR ligand-binding domain-containing protein [Desulfobacter latus]